MIPGLSFSGSSSAGSGDVRNDFNQTFGGAGPAISKGISTGQLLLIAGVVLAVLFLRKR